MRRFIVVVAFAIAIAVGGYMWFFKQKELKEGYDAARGYPAAKNPKEAADLFIKAIKARDYKDAAKYCTDAYSRELQKASDAALELGKGVDNLRSRLNDDQLMTRELDGILFYLDPLPKQLVMTVSRESEKDALATIGFDGIEFDANSPVAGWSIDFVLLNALTRDIPANFKVVKVGQGDKAVWKLDIPATPNLQAAVSKLVETGPNYAYVLRQVSDRVKNDATVKSDVKGHLRDKLENAPKF